MSVKIKKISIRAFRGIPDLELELDGKSLLLEGETGSGKSSIVEALEYFFTGTVSHLEGVQVLSLRRHGPHVNFTPQDVNIDITFDPGNIFLSRTFASAPSPPDELKDYFEVTEEGTFILHRSQILEFITVQPAERFRVIGSIIGVEPLDNVELEMMRLRDDLKGNLESKSSQQRQALQSLSTILSAEVTDVDSVVPALNNMLQAAGLPLISSLNELDAYAEAILGKMGSAERLHALTEVSETAKGLFISQGTVEQLRDFNNGVTELLEDEVKGDLRIANLLETGKSVIEQERMKICPLCEHPICRQRVLQRIAERRKTLRDLSDKASEIRKASVPIRNDLEATANKLDHIIRRTEQFDELSEERDKLGTAWDSLKAFIHKVARASALEAEIPIQEISQQKDELDCLAAAISTKCNELLESIGLTEEEKKGFKVLRLVEQVRNKVSDISELRCEVKAYEKYFEQTEKIYSAFSKTKKTKIQEIYNIIQEDIEGFYSTLHPNEPHKNIQLSVAFGRRASTELTMESFGRKGEDPRALASEGHLDSLGLCIFLAFVKKFNERCSLIVLDDVVTTLDTNHRENVCKLLIEQFGDKQLIVTTHDGVWYEELRAAQRAYGVDGDFKNMVILGWNVDAGPTIRPYKPRWEIIEEKIADTDKHGAGNEGRQYLEWLLEEICEVMEASVPFRRSGRYRISELLVPAKKRLEKLIQEDEYKEQLFEAFQYIETTMIMGNLLSHNNILANKVSIQEVRSFCNAVHSLHNVFLCPECGHFVGYFPKLRIIRCSNSRCNKPLEVKTN